MQDLRATFEEMARWKLDAKYDDNARYFYYTREASVIERNEKWFVIGRKGSGKSAISEYLCKQNTPDIFSLKLSFKNFPFNLLYSLEDQEYTPPNQYISIWKLVVYSYVCRLMVQNEAIDIDLRNSLSKLFQTDTRLGLKNLLPSWSSDEFTAKLFEFGAKVKKVVPNTSASEWQNKLLLFEQLIFEFIDNSTYYIVFDELDEDYKQVFQKQYDKYSQLITGLFKAVHDIRSNFHDTHVNIRPVIFLRDDIYELIKDSDKNKWSDHLIRIGWNQVETQNMLAHRISRTRAANSPILSFQQAWDPLFKEPVAPITWPVPAEVSIFTFIKRFTLFRPRDYMKFLQLCAERVTSSQGPDRKITLGILKHVQSDYSYYLRSELIDEVHPILPEIEDVLEVISTLRKPLFTVEEFKRRMLEYGKVEEDNDKHLNFILNILYYFSFIGNKHKRYQKYFFKFTYPTSKINYSEQLVVHRGLFRALEVS